MCAEGSFVAKITKRPRWALSPPYAYLCDPRAFKYWRRRTCHADVLQRKYGNFRGAIVEVCVWWAIWLLWPHILLWRRCLWTVAQVGKAHGASWALVFCFRPFRAQRELEGGAGGYLVTLSGADHVHSHSIHGFHRAQPTTAPVQTSSP